MRHFFFILFLALAMRMEAATTHYVSTSGNNGGPGSIGSPYLTIDWAVDHSSADDTIYVLAGLYPERVTMGVSGTLGHYINVVAVGAVGAVVCRGFALTDVSYARIIGFEITHTDATYVRGITFGGTCAYVEIEDNFIHEVNGSGITCLTSAVTSYITIRGNSLYFTGMVPGVITNYSAVGIGSYFITSDHWLVEYNTIQRSPDYVVLFGTNNIIRNNFLYDYADVYWGTTGVLHHSDGYQAGSDGAAGRVRNHLYERNMVADCIEGNSHHGIFQDTVNDGDTNIVARGEIVYNMGGGGLGTISSDHVCFYNLTYYKICQAANGAVWVWYKGGSGSTNASINNLGANTIIDDDGFCTDAFNIVTADGSTGTLMRNLGHSAGSETSYVSTADPQFVDPTSPGRDFHLQAGSPAINAGTNVVSVTSSSGSGTSFDVSDGQLLNDGWGMTEGDVITVNGNSPTRILSIGGAAGNTVTVADAQTWTNNAPVYWGRDTTPDIGALPFGSANLTGATIYNVGQDYTVTPTGHMRGGWFYLDGVPYGWVSNTDPTAAVTLTMPAGTVSAKAYPLYAQAVTWVNAAPTDPPGPPPPPATGSALGGRAVLKGGSGTRLK